MGDMADYWRDVKADKEYQADRKRERQERKANNSLGSRAMLKKNGFNYTEHNGGLHLVVEHNGNVADFYPTTGKFTIRGTGKWLRGVRMLCKCLRDIHVFKSADERNY